MAVQVETLGTLERRVSMSLPVDEIDRRIAERLRKLARDVKMPGFRPGKVPFKLVERQYGPQVRGEVLSDAVQKAFSDLVRDAKLRVAGYPRIEPKEGQDGKRMEFSATFEVYPDVTVGDLSGVTIEKPQVNVDDAAVDRTIEILRKQRVHYVQTERAAANGDRITVDFEGTIDGQPFGGGKAEAYAFVLGEGRMLPEFEAAALGMIAGASKKFDLKFPDNYHGKDVAGKTAVFTLKLARIEEAVLPSVDADFARSLGVEDGDVQKMRSEIRGNVEREVAGRIDARVKQQAMKALLDVSPVELPKALVEMESRQLVERAQADFQARGVKLAQLPFDPKVFEETAKRRVALGLVMSELARGQGLQPKPADVRARVEKEAQSYDNPAEVVKWFYMQPQRLSEMEGLALEGNVVNWILSKAKVVDRPQAFDELMAGDA